MESIFGGFFSAFLFFYVVKILYIMKKSIYNQTTTTLLSPTNLNLPASAPVAAPFTVPIRVPSEVTNGSSNLPVVFPGESRTVGNGMQNQYGFRRVPEDLSENSASNFPEMVENVRRATVQRIDTGSNTDDVTSFMNFNHRINITSNSSNETVELNNTMIRINELASSRIASMQEQFRINEEFRHTMQQQVNIMDTNVARVTRHQMDAYLDRLARNLDGHSNSTVPEITHGDVIDRYELFFNAMPFEIVYELIARLNDLNLPAGGTLLGMFYIFGGVFVLFDPNLYNINLHAFALIEFRNFFTRSVTGLIRAYFNHLNQIDELRRVTREAIQSRRYFSSILTTIRQNIYIIPTGFTIGAGLGRFINHELDRLQNNETILRLTRNLGFSMFVNSNNKLTKITMDKIIQKVKEIIFSFWKK